MATATSLTAETIEELMAGWEGVSVVQESQAALLSTFEAILATNTENLQNFEDVTLPAVQAELAASAISIANLTDNLVPQLQVDIAANTEDLENLNDVIIPDLQAGLNSNFLWIEELNTVTLPALYADLAANNAAVEALNTGTLPAMQTQLDANTTALEGIDLTGLNAELDALQAKFPVVGDDIAADTITSNNIEAHTITALEIAADTITANEIAADTITANEIAADTITANEIAADAVTANEIAANTITADEIAADAVTANEIAGHTITAAEIAADTITANEIAADTITANEIAADTITANEIAADTITANEIATDAITANEIAAGAVTALEIAALTITGDKIAADTIDVSKLIISDMTNLVVDGLLTDPASKTWFEMGAPNGMTRVKNADEPAYLKCTNQLWGTHIFFRNENIFEIDATTELFISMEISTPASNTEDLKFYPAVAVYDQNGVFQLWRVVDEWYFPTPPNTAWTKIEGTVRLTDPALATAQFNPFVFDIVGAAGTQEIRIRKVTMRRKGTGKLIVDGSIQGKDLEINTITADQIDTNTLTGDLFVGEVIFAGLMRAGDLDDNGIIIGGYSEMGARGIYTIDSNGDPVFTAPTDASDGAYLKAHLDLLSADVRGNFTMHGTNNSIATEAELTLSAGVEAPSVPPVLQQVWDQVQFNKTTAVPPHTPNAGYNMGTFAFNPAQATSMCFDTTWSAWVVIQQKSNGFRVWRFTTTGAIFNHIATGRPWVDDYNDRTLAATCFNDDLNGLATVFKSGDDWYVWAPNNINRIPSGWILDGKGPTLTYDTAANQYCLVQNNNGGSGTIHVRRFTITSGGSFPNATSVSTNNFESGSGVAQRINGAVFGSQLGVSSSWAINPDEYQTVSTYNGSGTAYNDEGTYRNWLKPGASLGFAHNGTQFASVDSAGVLTLYENWTWTTLDSYVWVGASAADTDVAGDTANPHAGQTAGTHETPVGTMKSINLYRRSKLQITMPETNDSGGADDPDKWRLYFKRGSTVAPTDKTLLKLIGDIGSPTSATTITITTDPTGGNPPGGISGQPTALNNFPGADPGRIESAAIMAVDSLPILSMKGDGSGRWGTLTVDTDGNAVIGGDTGWLTPSFASPWTNYGSPYANAAYRRIGKRVYLRGLVKGTGATTGVIFTLPAGFRITTNGIFNATAVQVSASFAATGDNPGSFTTGSSNSHTHSANPPSMDVKTVVTFTDIGVRIDIRANGEIAHANSSAASGTNWISLEGLSFLVD